jgi:DNA-binding transcriptional ArsR family regulator
MRRQKPQQGWRPAAPDIRRRIDRGGERLWRFVDFSDLPISAVAQALSRLTRLGLLRRVSKGVYYRGRETTFGVSLPNPAAIRKLAFQEKNVFPSGIAAANLLGLTTQTARRGEVSTRGFRLPRKLLGHDTVVHTRRPEAWTGLSDEEAAVLDFLRRGGRTGELPPHETVNRLLAVLRHPNRFERLLKVAHSEPPRVRAMLGALGEEMGTPGRALARLKASLNPLSRYDFGILRALPGADRWQAKKGRRS